MSPFIKLFKGKNKGKYKSPSGKIFTQKQVDLYYANNKSFQKNKKSKKSKKSK